MKIQQVSLFLENKPGQLQGACQILADAGINILTLSLADTAQFGILRIIVPDYQRAKDMLEAQGWVVKLTEVLAVEVNDEPGGLAKVLDVLQQQGVNVEYMYAFTFRRNGRAVLIFRFEDTEQAIAALQRAGIDPVSPVDLFGKNGST